MLATVQTKSNDSSSFRKLTNAALGAQVSPNLNIKEFQGENDTWNSYLRALREATIEAIRAKKLTQRDYLSVIREENTWSTQIEIGLANDYEDLVYKALLCKNACRDKASHIKILLEKYTLQVSILKQKLLFWEDQINIKWDRNQKVAASV